MMQWKTEITNQGAELIARAVTSGDIVFTRAIGSSTLSGATDLKTVTEVSEPQYELKLKSIDVSGTSAKLTIRLLNDGVTESYIIRQVGIYAKMKDEADDILISISENSIGETVPTTAEIPEWVCDMSVVLNMENSIRPSIVIPSGVYANIEHTHSTDEITDLPEISGKNLLDNPDFMVYENNGHTTDDIPRWTNTRHTVMYAPRVKALGPGVRVVPYGSDDATTYIHQRVYFSDFFKGKTVTFSAMIDEVSFVTDGLCLVIEDGINQFKSADILSPGVYTCTASINANASILNCMICSEEQSPSITVKWVKLEMGPVATPFIPPNHTDELIRLQNMNTLYDGSSILSNDVKLMNNTMVVNPNLIDNPDFKINQRGLSEFSCGSTQYCADRWYVFKQSSLSTNGTIRLLNPGVTLISGGTVNDTYLAQRISNGQLPIFPEGGVVGSGPTVTVSFKISKIDGALTFYQYGNNLSTKEITSTGIFHHTFEWNPETSDGSTKNIILFCNSSADCYCIIEWVKLEIGDFATRFVSPNQLDELIKIQTMTDDGYPKLVSNDSLPSIVNSEMVSNPNLLDNPDFKINQRREAIVSGIAFCVDRWLVDARSKVIVMDDGIKIEAIVDSPEAYWILFQPVPHAQGSPNITETVYVSEISISEEGGEFFIPSPGNDSGALKVGLNTHSFNGYGACYIFSAGLGIAMKGIKTGDYIIIKYIKGEFGKISTQFIPPNPIEELLKIQSMNDDGTPKLVSNGSMPTIMNSQMVSNPNLLDNPDFRINQRGQSEYTANGYGVDRWHIHNTAKLTVNDGYITYENTTNNATPPIYQNIGNASEFAGKTVTITFDCDILTGGSITIQVLCDEVWYPSASAASFSQTGRSLKSITVTLPDSVSILRPSLILHPTTEVPIMKVNIYSAKLELGGVSTPFVAPNYTDELIKIQSMNDNGAPKLVSNGALPTIMNSEMVSNPNLLDNPDFKINQRGLSVYSQSAKGPKMSIDRWAIYKHSSTKTGDVTLTPSSSGGSVLNNQTDGKACMYQRIENFSDLFGKQITYSASINGSVLSLTTTCTNATAQSGNPVYTEDRSAYLRIWVVLDTYIQFEIYLEAGASITVDWTKVEIGGTPTPFIPPNPALELEKCQRYLWVVRSNLMRMGSFATISNTSTVHYLYSPVVLRAVPTISFENMILYGTNSASVSASIRSIEVRGITSNMVKLFISTKTSMTAGALFELANISGSVGMIELSSEI